MNLPNKLTMLRILLVPFFVVFVYFEKYPVCQVLALVLFISASITDLLDGRIARSRNLVTDFGKFMDPIADKLLVMSAFVMLVEQQRMPGWVCILMLAREFIVSGFRQRQGYRRGHLGQAQDDHADDLRADGAASDSDQGARSRRASHLAGADGHHDVHLAGADAVVGLLLHLEQSRIH